jgi:hypothetical protein
MVQRILLTALVCLGLAGCGGGSGLGYGSGYGYYGLIEPGSERVARGMTVTPTIRWNRARRTFYDIPREENWTLNGPLLDNLTFIGGL